MMHSFNTMIANKYGVNCSLVLSWVVHWLAQNVRNGQNFHDGRHWVYGTIDAIAERFPYLTRSQIRYALRKLRKENVLMTGNFNKLRFDRTTWYALTDFGMMLLQEVADKAKGADEPDKSGNRQEVGKPETLSSAPAGEQPPSPSCDPICEIYEMQATKSSDGKDTVVQTNGQQKPMEGTTIAKGMDKIDRAIPITEPITETITEGVTEGRTVARSAPPRHQYGMYKNVLLTDEELAKVKQRFPTDWEWRIDRLSEYMESKGARYKSHYATILSWARMESERSQEKQKAQAPRRIIPEDERLVAIDV